MIEGQEGVTWDDWVALAEACEEHGVEALFRSDHYVSGFDAPTFVTAAPGESDRLYVVEQAGRIRYVVHRHIAGTFLDIRARVKSGGGSGKLARSLKSMLWMDT